LLYREIVTPVRWVRVDPDYTWLRPFNVNQDVVMWIWQMISDRDVVAQYVLLAHSHQHAHPPSFSRCLFLVFALPPT
jgi:hypothetical protein